MDPFSSHHLGGRTPITAQTTAVLVVDMLHDFCLPGGAMVLPGYERLIAPQNAVIRAVRAGGGCIIFIIDSHRPQARRDREFLKRTPHCLAGTNGVQLIPDLDQSAADIQVIKRRYSGFFNTDLDVTLKDMMVDTVIIIGVVTNICVRATVHDAFFHGYTVIVPQDCCAATGPREQLSTLYDISTHFGTVTDSHAIVQALNNNTGIDNMMIPG